MAQRTRTLPRREAKRALQGGQSQGLCAADDKRRMQAVPGGHGRTELGLAPSSASQGVELGNSRFRSGAPFPPYKVRLC
jgi:hypothetical protein